MPEHSWTTNAVTNANTSTSSGIDFAQLAAMSRKFKAKQDEDDRKVFYFPGTMDELKRTLSEAGMLILDDGRIASGQSIPGMPGFPMAPLGSLEIRRHGAGLLIGTEKAIDAFEDQERRRVDALFDRSPYRPGSWRPIVDV